MKIFGKSFDLESLRIPPILLNAYCVIGVQEQCAQAILYALNQLQQHQRIENLILIEPNLESLNAQLHTIAFYGCKIYSYFKNPQITNLKKYENFAQFGLVVIAKK